MIFLLLPLPLWDNVVLEEQKALSENRTERSLTALRCTCLQHNAFHLWPPTFWRPALVFPYHLRSAVSWSRESPPTLIIDESNFRASVEHKMFGAVYLNFGAFSPLAGFIWPGENNVVNTWKCGSLFAFCKQMCWIPSKACNLTLGPIKKKSFLWVHVTFVYEMVRLQMGSVNLNKPDSTKKDDELWMLS